MALPRRTTGSLWPTFVSARLVSLAVRQAYAIALDERFPTALSLPSRASATLWEGAAPANPPLAPPLPVPARQGAGLTPCPPTSYSRPLCPSPRAPPLLFGRRPPQSNYP